MVVTRGLQLRFGLAVFIDFVCNHMMWGLDAPARVEIMPDVRRI